MYSRFYSALHQHISGSRFFPKEGWPGPSHQQFFYANWAVMTEFAHSSLGMKKSCWVNPLGYRHASSCLSLCSCNPTHANVMNLCLYASIVSPKWLLSGSSLHPVSVQCVGVKAQSVQVLQQLWRVSRLESSLGCLCWDCIVTHLLPWSSSNSFHRVWFESTRTFTAH